MVSLDSLKIRATTKELLETSVLCELIGNHEIYKTNLLIEYKQV